MINFSSVWIPFSNKILSIALQQKSAETGVFLREGRLFIPAMDSLCGGLNLKIGKLYLIAGNSQHINICNYVKEYSEMTIVERRGFAGAYKKGCSCAVCKTILLRVPSCVSHENGKFQIRLYTFRSNQCSKLLVSTRRLELVIGSHRQNVKRTLVHAYRLVDQITKNHSSAIGETVCHTILAFPMLKKRRLNDSGILKINFNSLL